MRSHIAKIIGKRIRSIVLVENDRDPREQVFLIFDDGTYFELFGERFSCGTHFHDGDVDYVVRLLERYGVNKEIKIYPPGPPALPMKQLTTDDS